MIVVNKTPYPSAEVERLVRRAMGGRGRDPGTVLVRYRELPSDSREGFTPFDHSEPTDLWVEPPYRYPQPGARTWRHELFLSAAHEAGHTRHKGRCVGNRCEVLAEAYAHHRLRKVGLGQAVGGRLTG